MFFASFFFGMPCPPMGSLMVKGFCASGFSIQLSIISSTTDIHYCCILRCGVQFSGKQHIKAKPYVVFLFLLECSQKWVMYQNRKPHETQRVASPLRFKRLLTIMTSASVVVCVRFIRSLCFSVFVNSCSIVVSLFLLNFVLHACLCSFAVLMGSGF